MTQNINAQLPWWLKILPRPIKQIFSGREVLLKTATNTGWLFVDYLIRFVLAALVGVLVARYLGPEKYGLWNYAVAFTSFFGSIASLGLNSVIIRDIVKNPEKTEEFLGTGFILKLISGTVAVLLVIVSISFIRSGDVTAMLFATIIAMGFIFQSFDVIDFYFQAKIESKFTVYAKNPAYIIANLFKLLLIYLHAPLVAFVWTALFEIILGSIGLVLVHKVRKLKITSWKYSSQLAKNLLRDSWPLIFTGFAIATYMRIDQIMIGNILGDGPLGNYSAATNLTEVWNFLPLIISSSVFPALIDAKKISVDIYASRLQSYYDFMTWSSLGISLAMTFLAQPVINILYGAQYTSASGALEIYVWSTTAVFLSVATGQYLVTENRADILFYRSLIGAILNVTINLYSIPHYGINGAAYATVISYTLTTYLGNLFFTEGRPIFSMLLNSFNPRHLIKYFVD